MDAMQGGGILRIRLRAHGPGARAPARPRITIGDNGHGIPALTLAHIYEPFFTTRTDMGTGLGLWVSTTLVEEARRQALGAQQHGAQKARNRLFDRFALRLPVAREVRRRG